MATSKTHARRPNHRGPVDAREAKMPAPKMPAPEPLPQMIELTPSPDAGEAITIRQQASMILVEDKASHVEALEFLRGAKQLKRKIEDHWSRITRNVDDLKRNLLDLKRRDLEPLEVGIELLNTRVVAYVEAEKRREQEQADKDRREREDKARRDRELELAKQEEEALRVEASSPKLSAREELFVENYMRHGRAKEAAMVAGFQNPAKTSAKLLETQKIIDAIEAKRVAEAIRTQASEIRRQPVVAAPAAKVESNLGKVAGTKMMTTYAAEVYDLDALITAVGLNPSLRPALAANLVHLNKQAGMLRESFEACYPGVRLIKRSTVAG